MTREFDTARLTFRVPVLGDFEDSAAMWGDADVVRYIGNRALTREESWARLMRHVGHWHLLGYGLWTVRDRANGAFVGEVGLINVKRELEPSLGDSPEIGWVLSPASHGRGYGTEAAGAALAWIEKHHEPARTVCLIQPENAASRRLAAKCGYEEFARTSYRSCPVILFERLLKGSRADLSS